MNEANEGTIEWTQKQFLYFLVQTFKYNFASIRPALVQFVDVDRDFADT